MLSKKKKKKNHDKCFSFFKVQYNHLLKLQNRVSDLQNKCTAGGAVNTIPLNVE